MWKYDPGHNELNISSSLQAPWWLFYSVPFLCDIRPSILILHTWVSLSKALAIWLTVKGVCVREVWGDRLFGNLESCTFDPVVTEAIWPLWEGHLSHPYAAVEHTLQMLHIHTHTQTHRTKWEAIVSVLKALNDSPVIWLQHRLIQFGAKPVRILAQYNHPLLKTYQDKAGD